VTERAHLRETVHVTPLPVSLADTGVSNASNTESNVASGKWYGTRLATVILVRRDTREAVFIERDVWQLSGGQSPPVRRSKEEERQGQRLFRFQLGG
jgi:uncharacterized protein with NRDE domain